VRLERSTILDDCHESALGMLPLALAFGAGGNEILQTPGDLCVLGGFDHLYRASLCFKFGSRLSFIARFGSLVGCAATGSAPRDDAQRTFLRKRSPPILVG